jgi:hypothetical protein
MLISRIVGNMVQTYCILHCGELGAYILHPALWGTWCKIMHPALWGTWCKHIASRIVGNLVQSYCIPHSGELNIAGNARPHATKHPFYYALHCGEPVLVFLVQFWCKKPGPRNNAPACMGAYTRAATWEMHGCSVRVNFLNYSHCNAVAGYQTACMNVHCYSSAQA